MTRTGAGRLVFVSGGGTHYHHDEQCKYLAKGQRRVELRGGEVAVVKRVQLRSVVKTHDPCKWCVIKGHTDEVRPTDIVRPPGKGSTKQRVDEVCGTDPRALKAAERARDRRQIARIVGNDGDALLWIRLGFTEDMVRAFRERAWKLTDAVGLRESGFSPVEIQRWLRSGAEGDQPPR